MYNSAFWLLQSSNALVITPPTRCWSICFSMKKSNNFRASLAHILIPERHITIPFCPITGIDHRFLSACRMYTDFEQLFCDPPRPLDVVLFVERESEIIQNRNLLHDIRSLSEFHSFHGFCHPQGSMVVISVVVGDSSKVITLVSWKG